MLEKVRANFHLGTLVYDNDMPVAWVSVGPVIDFYWAWKRVGQLGDTSKDVACITCITRKKEFSNKLPESEILDALKAYGRVQGWLAIEGYPFDQSAIEKHGKRVTWPGFPQDFERAGFQRTGKHWLNSEEYSRSIYRFDLV